MSEPELSKVLIYGAYGYTGELIASEAARRGLRPILGGRSAAKLEPLAARLGLEHRQVSLDDAAALDAALDGVDVVQHCAGPFSQTSAPMVEACLRTQTHYLDITGEIAVFEACAALDQRAKDAGIMVMPGTGFDVVPSDCLAAHLAGRLPEATHLVLAFESVGSHTSHGTASTMVEGLGEPNLVRRGGQIVPVRMGKRRRSVDFGRGPTSTLGIPWGDVSTAFHSTAIPNIEVYVGVPAVAAGVVALGGFLGPVLRSGFVRRRAQARVDAAPPGPTDERRAAGFTLLWGEARVGDRRVSARLRTPEGYTLTMLTGLEIARRAAGGDAPPGFQTPSMAYGADFILSIDGVEGWSEEAPRKR